MKYEIEVISPLHIGSGGTISPIEYVVEDNFYRADMDRLFEDERFDTDRFIEGAKGGALYLGRFAPELAKEHVRYALDISQSTRTNLQGLIDRPSSEVREYIKTKDDVYIPGSSLKGAIRTAILWWVLKNDADRFDRAKKRLNNLVRSRDRVDKKRVGDEIEKLVFGTDPTKDILKTLQVSDTSAINVEELELEEVRTLTTTPRGHNWKSFCTYVEALKPRTKLDLEMKIDEFLLEGDAASELHFESKQELVREIPKMCEEFAKDFIEDEIRFFELYNNPRELEEVLEFYKSLKGREDENSFLLHLAWGSGWHGMTVGRLLEPNLLGDLRRKFRLGKARVPEFPKTRRIVFEDEKPKYPLGWIKLKVKNE
jgi:CRISPR-associated protein Csm5